MFTGIVQSIGKVASIENKNGGKRITVALDEHICKKSSVGDSISINGVCSTIYKKTNDTIFIEYMPETLSKTYIEKYHLNEPVNLELALTLATPLGGHLVTGHIDETGSIQHIDIAKEWTEITIKIQPQFAHLIVEKGCITMDGISLTILNVSDTSFQVNIITHTLEQTTLSNKEIGMPVHLEYDIIGKYCQRYVECYGKQNKI